jgi:Dolichyl-phosphate-mannose-protein mannosyltransferase/Tetratricopeptide repeat
MSAPHAGAPRVTSSPALTDGSRRGETWTALGWIVWALATGILLAYALTRHPVGDYQTESDFYGGYAAGARALLHGRVDVARYSVVGPGYEVALALITALVGDAFLAARLLSVTSASAVLLLWLLVLRRRLGSIPAVWTVAFLAANAVFFRYGYSATTDMLACALQAASIFLLLRGGGPRVLLASGLFAALATLTRYNSVALLPAGLIVVALSGSASRGRGLAAFLIGFGAPVLAWFAYSGMHGAIPGAALVHNLGFYRDPTFARNLQDAPATGAEIVPRAGGAMAAILIGALRNIPEHLMRDGVELMGWPVAVLALAGIAAALRARVRGQVLPLGVVGAALFLALTPVFYSDRYSLAVLPIELTFAGLTLAAICGSRRLGRAALPMVLVLALPVLGVSLGRSTTLQAGLRRDAPIETVEAGRALRRVAPPTGRVVSRKGHIGYYSDREVVSFPRFATLAELAGYSREQHADYLFYSWYEAGMRPEFRFLLDTTAAVPGLELVHATRNRASVLYRVWPGFGREPAWRSDPFLARVHDARAMLTVLPDSESSPYQAILAVEAISRGATSEGLELATRATRASPRDTLGWIVQGDAHRLERRLDLAQSAYEHALALNPQDAETRVALGEVQLESGHSTQAARTLRPVLALVRDPNVLETLESLYGAMGDPEAARAARNAMSRAPSRRRAVAGP